GALAGVRLANALDANYAGAIATALGGLFGLAFLLAPHRGLAARAWRRQQQQREFARTMLAVHLLNHENTAAMETEKRLHPRPTPVRWTPAAVDRVVRGAERRGLAQRRGEHVVLTDAGRALARQALGRP